MRIILNKKSLWVLLPLFIFITCSSENSNKQEELADELPPSLQTDVVIEIQRVELSDQQRNTLIIETKQLVADNFSYIVAIPGVVFPAPDYISLVSAPIQGRVVGMYAHEGETVRKGQLLMELESLEFANFVSDYLQARAEKLYQANQLERIKLLVNKKISPERILEKVEADYARASAAEQASHTRLLSIGVKQTQIDIWDTGRTDQPFLKVYAPIYGIITEHLIDHGQAVSNYEKMIKIINLDKVLIKGYASPEDGSLIKPGDPAEITQKDFPDQKLLSNVATINPALDPINKSITINVITKSLKRWPRPGQNVRLNIIVTTPEPVISIPISAIEYEGDLPAVFVQIDQNTYEKRFVRVRRYTGEAAIIESGLKGNEIIAISQVFSLKALSKFAEFGEE